MFETNNYGTLKDIKKTIVVGYCDGCRNQGAKSNPYEFRFNNSKTIGKDFFVRDQYGWRNPNDTNWRQIIGFRGARCIEQGSPNTISRWEIAVDDIIDC